MQQSWWVSYVFVTGALCIYMYVLKQVAAKFLDLIVLSDSFLLSIAYLWSRHNSEVPVSFMFGIRFKVKGTKPLRCKFVLKLYYRLQAQYLPWVLVGYDYLTTGVLPIPSFVGIAAAHIYYYLTTTYPSQGGRRYLATPAFLQRMFPPTVVRGSGGFQMWPGRAYQQQQQQQQQSGPTNIFGGHRWGRGYRLGSW